MKETFNPDLLRFRGTTDRDAVSYGIGDPMTFTFSMDYKGDASALPVFFVRWTRAGDDGGFDNGMSVIAPGGTAGFTTSLDRPGFVHVFAELVTADGKALVRTQDGVAVPLNFDGGAGAAVDRILPAAEEPEGFDAFWAEQRRILDAVPLKFTAFPVPEERIAEKCRGRLKVSVVYVDCAGPRPVTGYLYEKIGAAPGSMPARCCFHGYGCEDFSDVRFGEGEMQLAETAVTFNVNAHGYELDREKEYYTEMNKKLDGYALSKTENVDPHTAYFRNMAFRVMRAFDYMKSHPLWNGRDLWAQGGSQGGFQTVWAGSLVSGLTVCRPEVTWCSDMAGTTAGRLAGWCPEYVPGLDFYDSVFHSRRIPASCLLEVTRFGLGDYVCPPSGTAAHFNAANCPKKLVWVQNSQHGYQPPADEREVFRREFPAGCGIRGRAPVIRMEPRPPVTFVPARLDASKWRLFREDGSAVDGFTFSGIRGELLKGRAPDGSDLNVETSVRLTGVLIAEADGYALLGAGIDWWWQVSVNGVPVFGRTRAIGCNDYSSFDRTDWIFRAPVRKGENEVVVDVVLGKHGTASVDVLPDTFADREIPQRTAEQYDRIRASCAALASDPEWRQDGSAIRFRSVQPFPAGIEYREKGTEEWTAVWDGASSEEHTVVLDPVPAGVCEARIVQNVYLCSWSFRRSGIFELTF